MSFDLQIAAKPDPHDRNRASGVGVAASRSAFVSLVVSGAFGEASQRELLRRVRQSFDDGADTVNVEMRDITLDDRSCLERFAASLMAERGAGRHVQLVARDQAFHALCASVPGSRDWLVTDTTADTTGGRRALHFDSSAEI